MKHLLAIEQLSREEIEAILDRAESFAEVGRRDIKKVPTLRGRTIVSLEESDGIDRVTISEPQTAEVTV